MEMTDQTGLRNCIKIMTRWPAARCPVRTVSESSQDEMIDPLSCHVRGMQSAATASVDLLLVVEHKTCN